MSHLVQSTFAMYQQTDQEFMTGQVLTATQKENIQNQIARIAELRLAITPDPNNYATFIQEEANYKGQMQALQYLLDCSNSAEAELTELAYQQQQSQL